MWAFSHASAKTHKPCSHWHTVLVWVIVQKTCHADTWQRYPQIPQSRNSLQQSWRWCRPHSRSWRLPCICGLRTVPPLTTQGIITIPICPGLYTGLSVWIKVFFSACLIRTFCFFWTSESAPKAVISIKATSSGCPTGGGTCRHNRNHNWSWISFVDPQSFVIMIFILISHCSSHSCPERYHSTFQNAF